MPLMLVDSDASYLLDIPACLGWLASGTMRLGAMELRRARGEEARGREAHRAPRGSTSSRWLREPGPWLCITLNRLSRTASPSTAHCSSSARTT